MNASLSDFFNYQRVELYNSGKNNCEINGKMSSESDSELLAKIKMDNYFRFCNFQTGFGVCSFSRLNDFSGGGFFNRKTYCDRSYARTGSSFWKIIESANTQLHSLRRGSCHSLQAKRIKIDNRLDHLGSRVKM